LIVSRDRFDSAEFEESHSMMTKVAIQSHLREFILQQFPAARSRAIADNDSLLEAGIIDSLGVLEVVTMIEQDFGVMLDDEELMSDHFESIARLAALVHDKLAAERVS
jgi:acyl carrier protein